MKWVLKYLIVLAGLVIITCPTCFAGKKESTSNNQPLKVDESIFQRELSKQEIETVLGQFDTYDYVRTKNQKEDVVNYLLNQSEKLAYNKGAAKCKNILGVLFRDRAEYAKAIKLHESALQLSETDTILSIYSLNNLGVAYRRLDKPRMALDYHMKALQLAEKFTADLIFAKRNECIALNSIGNINLILNQPEKALDVFNESLILEEQLFNDLGIAINYQNIGVAYEAMDKLETALNYYKKSLKKNEKINSVVGLAICYNSIGEIFLKKDNQLEALKNFRLALAYAQQSDDVYYISQTHANIGKAYLDLDLLDKALPELIEFNKIAEKIRSRNLISESNILLSNYYEKTGELSKALILYKKSVLYSDSIVNEKNSRYLNDIQTLHDSKKKQQQIELLTIENKLKTQQNYISLAVLAVLILLSIVIYFVTLRESEKQKADLEAKLFSSLMNPHFVFNALASIQSFLYKNEPERAATYLGYFSKLTRSILKNSSKELITLGEEIDALKYYIEIEQMRKSNGFTYTIEIDNEIELDFIYVLPTMIQPFVENAIHHGLSGSDNKSGLLRLEIKQFDEFVRIVITDNGIGINANINSERTSDHKSMGLTIFKERISLFERKYKKSVNFTITDLSDRGPGLTGTMVTIDFPLIEPNDKSNNY